MKEDKNFGGQEPCLSEQELLEYISGTLDHKRQHQVEMHLENCELCREAMEGFEQMEFPMHYPEIREELNKKWQESLGNGARPSVVFPWRIAAAFALIAFSMTLLYFILPDRSEKQFSEAFEPYPAQALPETTASEIVEAEDEVDPAQANPPDRIEEVDNQKSPVNDQAPLIHQEDKEQVRTEELSAPTQSQESVTMEAPSDMPNATSGGNSSTFSQTESDHSTHKVQPASAESKSIKKSNSSDIPGAELTLYNQALALYQQGKYAESQQLLKGIKTIPEARFYAGLCALSLSEAERALDELRKFERQAGDKMQEERLWYESLAHIKLKDISAAEKKLKIIIELNGTYREQALSLLEKIN